MEDIYTNDVSKFWKIKTKIENNKCTILNNKKNKEKWD